MRIILFVGIILAATATAGMSAQSSVTSGVDSTISQMKQDIQTQIERIRRARDTASSQMTLARIRIAEQLRRSEEDLTRQIESLERFREQMAEQRGDSDQALNVMQRDWKQFIQQAFSDLDSQLRDTNNLITQMETLRDRFDVEPEALSDPSREQIMLQIGPTLQIQAPATSQPVVSTQPATPTIALTPTENSDPLTPTVVPTMPTNSEPVTPTVVQTTPTSTGST